MLFAGTGRAFYYSLDDGATWTQFKDGLPPAPVSWITVEPRFHDVVVSTYGRGLFILPNITLLEQTGQPAPAADDDASVSSRRRSSARRAACSADRPSALHARAGDRAGRAGQDGDPRRERQGRSGRRWSPAHQG